MRALPAVAAILMLSGCSAEKSADPGQQAWYRQTTAQLIAADRQAEDDFAKGKKDDAAAIIEKAEPMAAKLLAVPRPTLEAAEAASDLDDLYGRMLLSNRHFGWARLLFQKNLSRWKHWEPQTDETRRRLKLAETEIAECDKHID